MRRYIGIKAINAKPMSRLEYNNFRKWLLPVNENGADNGYLVEYIDGGQANTEEYSGYVSWSPKEVFDKAYKTSGSLGFEGALAYLKDGYKVARKGWNGKGMFIFLAHVTEFEYKGSTIDIDIDFPETIPNCLAMKTAQEEIQIGWLASQADMLAEDWEVLL